MKKKNGMSSISFPKKLLLKKMRALNKVEQGLVLLIMTKDFDDETNDEEVLQLDNFCEECKKEDPSVSQNLILTGFKTCNSCKLSKTIFPI